MPKLHAPEPPASFWMGGFEGADHINGAGEAHDMVQATGHAQRLDADYRAARRLGLRGLRESIGWRLSERPGGGDWDLARAVRMAEAAARQRVRILWTLMHYGLPGDLTLLDDALIPRFARFAAEVARVLAPLCPAPRVYTPINEISFLSWAASATGDMGPAGVPQGGSGDSRISGYLIKQRLVRAALAGMAAIRAADPGARFLHVEPVVHVVPHDADDPEQRLLAQRIASYQWQTFDMLAGRMDPELGGHVDALDWLGLNHYHSSQWEVPSEKRLAWHLRDPRRQPLSQLLKEVWQRYRRPLIVAETGHIGVGRAAWLHEVAGEAQRARALGVPLQGVCLYPLLDRPDWNDTRLWHRSGLWHLPQPGTPALRSLNRPFARALLAWRGLEELRAPPAPPDETPGLLVLLPCAWEDWRAPREALLQAWSAQGPVRVLESPRPGPAEPVLRRHTLAPGAELLVLHGGDAAGGWTRQATQARLGLLRQGLAEAGRRRWIAWLVDWRADGEAAWWRELAGAGLVLQPDAARPPGPGLRQRAGVCLPAGWPLLVERPARGRAPCYEDEEVARLLRDVPAPRLWLKAPAAGLREGMAAALRELASRLAPWQVVVDAAAPVAGAPVPRNLHWLGPVHDSLHAALAAQVQEVRGGEGQPLAGLEAGEGWGALRREQLPGEVARLLARVTVPAASALPA